MESSKISDLEKQLENCLAKNAKAEQSIKQLEEEQLKRAKKKYFNSLAEREVSEHTLKSFQFQKENLQSQLSKLKLTVEKQKNEDRSNFEDSVEKISDFNLKHDYLSYRKQRVERENLCKELRSELEAEEAKLEKMQVEKEEEDERIRREKLEEMKRNLQDELRSLEAKLLNNQNALETLEIKFNDIKDKQLKNKEVLSLQKILKELEFSKE